MTSSETNRRLLGAFVRAHRELLQAAPGAPHGLAMRRRTPGLRREEVAQLCGMSPTWYTWIEQGRDVSVSPQALARLADALRLSRAERAYLFDLAGRRDPSAPIPAPSPDAPPALIEAVARFPEPAYGLDRYWNACCWNDAAADLFEGWLGGSERNLLRYVFRDASARTLISDWDDRARRLVAEFRADFSRALNDPRMRELVETLRREATLFDICWREQAVMAREGGLRGFDHPRAGRLTFEQYTFNPADRPDYKLVLLVRRSGADPA